MTRPRLWFTLILGALSGCYAPLGPLGHRPELLFRMAPTQPMEQPEQAVSGPPLIVPLLSSQVTYPTGAFYNLQQPDLGPLAHTYGSREPEAAFYEGLVGALRRAGHNAVRDYDSGRVPQPEDRAPMLRGEIHSLEIDSIHPAPEAAKGEDERTVYDAARARLVFTLYQAPGQRRIEFAVIAGCKLRRGSGDILRELGKRTASEVDACLRKNVCMPLPALGKPQNSDEPHRDGWAALEDARFGEGARP